MADHGIAVFALMDLVDLTRASIHLQCECGWHKKLGEVTTAEALAREAADHRKYAGGDDG